MGRRPAKFNPDPPSGTQLPSESNLTNHLAKPNRNLYPKGHHCQFYKLYNFMFR